MKRLKSVDSYFTRVAEIRDQLGNAGEEVREKELSIYILHGLPNAWESFVQSVTGCDLPKYDRLWADCVEEEARIMAKSGESHEKSSSCSSLERKAEEVFSLKESRRKIKQQK